MICTSGRRGWAVPKATKEDGRAVSLLFSDAADEFPHGAVYRRRGSQAVGHPDEGQQQALAVGNGFGERLPTVAVGLAYLPFHTVAVNGMLQPLLRHADQNLYGNAGLTTRNLLVNGSQRVSNR